MSKINSVENYISLYSASCEYFSVMIIRKPIPIERKARQIFHSRPYLYCCILIKIQNYFFRYIRNQLNLKSFMIQNFQEIIFLNSSI